MSRIWVVGITVAIASAFGSAYALTRGAGSGVAPDDARPLRVVLGGQESNWYDAGVLPRGGRQVVPFVLVNPGPDAVTIGTARTSCDCLRVELDATRVEAGTEVGGRAVVELAGEPGFAGGLMHDAEASAVDDGRPILALKLSIEVR